MTAQTEQGWVPRNTIGTRLVLVRRELGISQREASERTGIPYGSWQSLEDDRDVRGLARKIEAITATLGVDRDWLLWGTVPQSPKGLGNRDEPAQVIQTLPARPSPAWDRLDIARDLRKVA